MIGETILSVLGILNPLRWLKVLFDHFRRPRLEIYYDSAETYHKAHDVGFAGILGNFVHVMVKNCGRTVVKKCVGELKSIELLSDGEFKKIPLYRHVMQLKWAHESDYYSKDIEPGDSIRLDVCYVHKGIDTVHFFTKKYPCGNMTDFPPGKFKIKIRIKSDNTKSIERNFIVTYTPGNIKNLKLKNI